MNKCLLALLIVVLPHALCAQEPFSSLEERMTGKEFRAAGLDKLTEEELQVLNRWLRDHSVATLDGPAESAAAPSAAVALEPAEDRRGLRKEKERLSDDAKLITARLLGTFDGWDGNTVFRLDNGMIWKQDESDVFTVRPPLENPEVTIKRGVFNVWRLSVEGYNSRVKVERLQ
jgi:hypothetical protein